jgi:hypothetical protein
MEWEIWESASGNRLHATNDLGNAIRWVTEYVAQEGDSAYDVLSLGGWDDSLVAAGDKLRRFVANWESGPG